MCRRGFYWALGVVASFAMVAPAWAQPRGAAGDKVSTAIAQIASDVDDARKVRPTLVVWLFDASAREQPLRHEVAQNFGAIYKRPDPRPREGVLPIQPLWTAVVQFAGDVTMPIREPTENFDEVWTAVNVITDQGDGPSMTFAAIKQAADEYLPFRKKRAWHVIFVVVSDKPGAFGNGDGSPSQQIDSLAERFQTSAVPVFVIGASVPFSTQAAQSLSGGATRGQPSAKSSAPAVSDCLRWDRIDLAYAGGANDRDLRNSGFGPWALARLCDQSGGEFLAVRAMGGNAEFPFPADYLRKYAPDYGSEERYGKLLAANKCRQALVDAAALPRAEVLQNSPRQFVRQDEAQLNNLLGQAQRSAAAIGPQIDKLYETLAAAESDRERLTGARWQAGYDLAFGRALAAKARCDGYNTMLAVLKQGKSFTKPQSTTWVLKEAPVTTASSPLESLAKKARLYLERVVHDHPGTPWAESAAKELKAPLGWAWDEK